MNSQKNFSALAFLALGVCLLLPAFAELVDNKIYIVRHEKSAPEKDVLIGVEVARNEEGEEVAAGIFGIVTELWEPLFKKFIPANVTVEEVSLDKVPVVGLIEILKNRTELYSEALPYILAKTSPKTVAESLPGDLLATLTPEAKAKIAPKDLEELEKLYSQK